MKPFDLKAALNGEPVKLRSGEKAYIICDIRNHFDDINLTYPLIGIIEYALDLKNSDSTNVWSVKGKFFGSVDNAPGDIVGMWEDPKLTTEQIFEKAYAEDLPLVAAGKAAFVVAKTKAGDYILQIGDDYVYKADLSLNWDFYKPEKAKSKTITVTLPKPIMPKAGKKYWFISTENNVLCVTKVHRFLGGDKLTPDGNYFASEADAQAWLDALKEAMDDE